MRGAGTALAGAQSRYWSTAPTTVFETSAIIEHLAAFHPWPSVLIPADPKAAAPIRMLDRVFDSHVMAPMQAIVFDARRPEASRDAYGVAQAHTALDTIYAWLDQEGGRASTGHPVRPSRWPTQRLRPHCSMPTGSIRSARLMPR